MYRAEALFKEAFERQRAGDLSTAESLYRSALAADPELLPARVNLAIILRASARLAEALEVLGERSDEGQPAALYNERALTLLGLHRYDEAEASLNAALKSDRNAADAHHNLGSLLVTQGRYREALSCFEEAVRRNPREPKLHDGLGVARLAVGDIEGAMRSMLRAIEGDPRSASAWCHLGDVDRARGAFASAHIAYGCALTLEPNHKMAHWGQTLAWLSAGDFERGWAAYERRFELGLVRLPAVRARPWRDQSIAGARVLVLGEQGIGDEIMFARFVHQLARDGARPVLTCEPRLASLFERSFPGVEIAPLRGQPGEGEISADFSVPVGSLAGRYWSSGPASMFERSYLMAEPGLVQKWRARYEALGAGLKIGIAWRGGGDSLVRQRRSIALETWHELLRLPDIAFVNLQHGDCHAEIARVRDELQVALHEWPDSDPLRDLDDFAAKIAALDMVISVDNSTIHLAGALGRQTVALLPMPPDWRWRVERDDTAWYPSVTLLRQTVPGQWQSVLDGAAKLIRPRSVSLSATPSPAQRPTMADRVLLINDTSNWYHFGCTATSTALKSSITAQGFAIHSLPTERLMHCAPVPERLVDFDAAEFFERFRAGCRDVVQAVETAELIVINGEGSLHGQSDYARLLLYLAYIAATRFGKRVQIVNHSCYPESAARITDPMVNALYRKVYETLDFIAVREPLSAEILRALGLAPVQAFDCLPLYVAEHYRPRPSARRSGIVVAGSVAWRDSGMPALLRLIELAHDQREPISVLIGAQANPARDDLAFVAALRQAEPAGWALIEAQSPGAWLDTIGGARLLVSGRFHHSLAALCLGTPFVALESNTPKLHAVTTMLELPAPLAYSSPTLTDEVVAAAEARLATYAPPVSRDVIERLVGMARLNVAGLCMPAARARVAT